MKAKATMIVPVNYDELVKAKHFLISRNKSFRTIHVPVGEEEKMPLILTEMDILERTAFKVLFRAKSERMTVFG